MSYLLLFIPIILFSSFVFFVGLFGKGLGNMVKNEFDKWQNEFDNQHPKVADCSLYFDYLITYINTQ